MTLVNPNPSHEVIPTSLHDSLEESDFQSEFTLPFRIKVEVFSSDLHDVLQYFFGPEDSQYGNEVSFHHLEFECLKIAAKELARFTNEVFTIRTYMDFDSLNKDSINDFHLNSFYLKTSNENNPTKSLIKYISCYTDTDWDTSDKS